MHSHSHDHCGHSHHHQAHQRMSFAFWLNLIFAIIELTGGLFINSFAVTSNALHDLGDSLAIALSLVLEKKSHRKSDAQFSYGYRRFSIASAFLTSVFLVSGSCLVIFFGIRQLFEPMHPQSTPMMGFAVLGLLVNGFSLWSLRQGSSLNERVLSWHFVEDTLSWLLVLVAGALIRWTDWVFLDVTLGMMLSLWTLWNVQKSLRELLNIFLQATPKNISTEEISKTLCRLPQVQNVHHMHLWTLDGQMHILTAHVALKKEQNSSVVADLKAEIKSLLNSQFGISEVTLEFELFSEFCADPTHP